MKDFIDLVVSTSIVIGGGIIAVAGVLLVLGLILTVALGPFAIIAWAIIEAAKLIAGAT